MTYENDEIRKQKRLESLRKYREKNKEKLDAYHKKYYAEHREHLKALQHQRYMIYKYLDADDVEYIYNKLKNDEEDS